MSGLDLADIQGNIHRPYGRFGFPHTRHFFFNIANALAGRRFVEAMRPRVTTAEPWGKGDDGHAIKPAIALNIGFTFMGLHALDLPTETLRLLPDEFIDGMACRSGILGDVAFATLVVGGDSSTPAVSVSGQFLRGSLGD